VNDKAAAVTVVATAFDVAVVGWVLMRGTEPIGAKRVAQAAVAGASIVAAQFVGSVLALHNSFLWMTIAWAFGSLALPIVALLLLTRFRRRASAFVRALAWTSLATVPITIYAVFVEPYRLVTERADVPIAAERALSRLMTIGVLADIQCVKVTDREREAVRRVVDAKPDLILLPGDFVQVGTHRVHEIAPDFRALLAPLEAPLGVYCVQGDTDTRNDVLALIEGTRVRPLEDQVVVIEREDLRLTLAGIGLRYDSVTALAALRDLESRPGADDVRIAMAHRPDVVLELAPSSRVDLVVAGHTHGGQIAVPFLGPPYVSSKLPRRIGWGGLHDLEGRRLYISRGIGWEHGHAPRLRFCSPPEVTLLTLR
jgi:predicted MPP superfamily phosphohydrolase